MKATEQTILQIERVINKIAQKYPKGDEVSVLTDIHIRVSQDTGEMLAFDDDEQEITRCVVEQWIDSKDENFYTSIAHILQNSLRKLSEVVDGMGILKPYSFVLENDDKEEEAVQIYNQVFSQNKYYLAAFELASRLVKGEKNYDCLLYTSPSPRD